MKIGIIGAMSEEVEILKNEMDLVRTFYHTAMTFYEGTLLGKDVVIVTSGIGKVSAGICTQILADTFKVDSVINIGIAGGLREDVYPGDIVIAQNLVQHDFDVSFFGSKLGQIPRIESFDFPCDEALIKAASNASSKLDKVTSFIGRIVSGDQFIHEVDKLKSLNSQFNAYACEMEGAAIGQVCYLNKLPFVVIRSISDNPINGSHMDYETFADLAIKNSVKILREMLQHLKN